MRHAKQTVSIFMFATLSFGLLTVQAASGPDQNAPALAPYDYDQGAPEVQKTLLSKMMGKALPANLLDVVEWREDESFNLGDLRGKVVVLQFWHAGSTSWRSWYSHSVASQSKFGDKDLAVITIHTNQQLTAARDYIDRQQFPVATAIDVTGALTQEFHANARPFNVVLDRQGVVRYGGLTGRGVDAAIEKLIAAPFDPDAPAPVVFDPSGSKASATTLASKDDDAQSNTQKFDDEADENVDFPPFTTRVWIAKDIRGKQGPALVVRQWVADKPDTAGKVVIIDFWATWCGPCVASIPHTNALAEKFRDSVVVIGVSNEDFGVVRSSKHTKKMKYFVGVDPDATMQKEVGVRGIPHMIVMSPDGVVRFQGRPMLLTEKILGQIVRASAKLSQ